MGRVIEAFREKARKRHLTKPLGEGHFDVKRVGVFDLSIPGTWTAPSSGIQFDYGEGSVDLETDIVDNIDLLLERQEKLIKAVQKLAAFNSPLLASSKLFTELHLGDSDDEEEG